MKSNINLRMIMKPTMMVCKISIVCLACLFCSSSDQKKGNPKVTDATKVSTAIISNAVTDNTLHPQKLRITYDVVWSPKNSFVVLESKNLHGSGITYLIRYNATQNQELAHDSQPIWIKISSTNQDNQHVFPYLQNTSSGDIKTTYFSWQGRKSSVQTKVLSKENVYCRWEGIYNGFLLVLETEFSLGQNEISVNSIPMIIHKHVTQNMELF